MRQLIIKSLLIRKVRSLLTILGIAIGIGMIVALVSVTEGLNAEAEDTFAGMQMITVEPKQLLKPMPVSNITTIERIPGVTLVSPFVTTLVGTVDQVEVLEDASGGLIPPTIRGYDAVRAKQSASQIPDSIIRGRYLVDGDRNSVVLGKPIADRFRKSYGSTINIDGTTFNVVGVFETGLMITDNLMIVPLDTARNLRNMEPNTISGMSVVVDSQENIANVARRIEQAIPEVRATTPEEIRADFDDLSGAITTATWVIASVAAVVGGIGIVNSMVMNVMERRREIGILKAVGWTRGEVLRTFLIESTILGLLGGLAGVFIGVVGMTTITTLLPIVVTKITPELIIQALLFALILGAGGGLYPAWRAASVHPIEALRYD